VLPFLLKKKDANIMILGTVTPMPADAGLNMGNKG
jgi:hypothetical protein